MTPEGTPAGSAGRRIVHADAVFPGDADAIPDGAVVVDGAGEVHDAGPAEAVIPRHAGLRVERVTGVVLPGLVNAHTHLELSAMRGQVPGGAGFVPWVEHMLALRAEVGPETDAEAVDRAVDELDSCGTAAVGEVTNTLAAVRALARRGIAGCVFHEVFGVEREALERRVADLPEVVARQVGAWPGGDLAYAPTPHTLYTTHAEVVRRLLADARARGLRVSLHLAEHAGERRFLERGDGPVAEWYVSRLRIPQARIAFPGQPPVAFADRLGALAPDVLAVHLTDARPDELALVAARGSPVILCPRSNLFIEGRLPPLLAVRAAGITPAIGTDSLASNASLDVLAEARALADRFPSVPAGELLRMATWGGAQALGRPDLGRIARGARPGLFVVDGAAAGVGGGAGVVGVGVGVGAGAREQARADPAGFVLRHVKAPRRWLLRRKAGPGREAA
ncbi:MAG: amidohydrolase family protein [Myxococcales bacterium]|nr:amidohydrolase family protein [Myxococcales bacterium]